VEEQVDEVLDQEDYDLLNQAESMTARRKHDRHMPLVPGLLSVKRLADCTVAEPSTSSITATHFHADGRLFLVASEDKHVKVFKIDEEKNEKQVSVRFQDMMARSAKFVGVDGEIVVSGRKPYYYAYEATTGQMTKFQRMCSFLIDGRLDLLILVAAVVVFVSPVPVGSKTKTLETMEVSPLGSKLAFLGTEGYVHIADARSKQWIGDLKMNCTSRAVTFLDELTCVTSGFDADIYLWDLRHSHRPRCVSRFHHEDGTPTSALAVYAPPSSRDFNNNSAGSNHNNHNNARFFSLSNCYLSVATMSGVVSLFEGILSTSATSAYYSFSESNNASPKPLKSVMNLTTKITTSSFHPSGQILAIASNEVSVIY
jgi:U3 small nucleolar RNA-associated protein 18